MGKCPRMGAASFSNLGEYERRASSRLSNEKIKVQPGRDAKRGLLFDHKLPLDDERARHNAEMGDDYSEKLSR